MKDKYQLLNELQFQLGLSQRYAIILEQRVGNRMDVHPYLNLMVTAMTDAGEARDQLVKHFELTQEMA